MCLRFWDYGVSVLIFFTCGIAALVFSCKQVPRRFFRGSVRKHFGLACYFGGGYVVRLLVREPRIRDACW